MSIIDYFDTEFAVHRMVWGIDDDNNEFSRAESVTTFFGHVQQADAQLAQFMGLAFTKTFTVWCPLDVDVEEGDKLVADEFIYHVRAKQKHAFGHNKHTFLVCERELNIVEESL